MNLDPLDYLRLQRTLEEAANDLLLFAPLMHDEQGQEIPEIVELRAALTAAKALIATAPEVSFGAAIARLLSARALVLALYQSARDFPPGSVGTDAE